MSFLGTCEESIVKYRHAFLTLLDEKQLSKVVAADYLRLIKKFRTRLFKPNLLIIIKTIKKTQNI